jgi:hydrogenase-4 component B
MLVGYLAGFLSALSLPGTIMRRATSACTGAAAGFGILAAAQVILSQEPISFSLAGTAPLPSLSFCLDPLGAAFLLLIGVAAIPAAVFSVGYAPHNTGARPRRFTGCMTSLFLLTMSLVVMASGVFAFLVCWEAMSLASYFLVIGENQDPETLGAGHWYAAMAHAGFGLIAGALLLSAAGAQGMLFSEIRTTSLSLSPGLRNIIFGLALLGFGSKAGLVPLHVWLPRAHPAAPSDISALMSGVMVKLGIYGIARVSLDLLGGGPAWWGGVVLALGAASALLGVLYALMEHDLKRLLAYHTVENIGLISMGLGLALLFRGYGLAALAAFALVAALYHTLNHGVFKGLLFLGAGSVLQATGTRNMEEMGGLIHCMPVTAACFLVGAAAISGLPPLNGFASEWMLFQSLLAAVKIPNSFAAALMAVAVGMLALTAGLAAACFVKAFGISFLAVPRSREAAEAREVPFSMRTGMIILAAVCVLLGILPFRVAPFLARALTGLPGVDPSGVTYHFGLLMTAPDLASRMSPTYLALLMVLATALVPFAFRILRINLKTRRAESWGCGRVGQTSRMEYTSSAFAEPLRRVFSALYRPTRDVTIDFHPESKYFVHSISYRSQVRTWFEEILYAPLVQRVQQLGSSGRWIQSGSVHWYIGYIFVALLALLLLARWL